MSARACITENHRPARRPADFSIRRILEDFVDFFRGDAVLGTMLHVAIWIVIQVPDD
jgi:hypothetical protein